MTVQLCHLTGYVIALKATDVFTTLLDALQTTTGTTQRHLQCLCHTNDIVRSYIAVIGAASLFQARTRTRHHGQSGSNGLDDRNAETLIARRIDKGFCLCIDGREVFVGHATQQV